MNIWHGANSSKITSDHFIACIEISKDSKNKYELDKETGLLRLDRILYTSTRYPANYGFIPLTYAEDNDPLDVLVLCMESIVPMTLVDCIPIGVMHMLDNGQKDDKIIAICTTDPYLKNCRSISQLPKHILEEIKHFFSVYKTLEDKETVVDNEMEDADVAKKVIEDSIKRYNEKFKK